MQIKINKYPFLLWPVRAKEATLDGKRCITIVDGKTVENELISVDAGHIYIMKYLPMALLAAAMGWGYSLASSIGYILAAALLYFYGCIFTKIVEKQQVIYMLCFAGTLVIAAFLGYNKEVIYGLQYTYGGWLLYLIYSGKKNEEYKRYRAINGMAGIYVYVPYPKAKNNNNIAQKIAAAMLAVGIGLSLWHGYTLYTQHQKALEAAAAIKAEANTSKPIITHATPKRQESAAELEARRRLGLGGGL